jgi:galactokinase
MFDLEPIYGSGAKEQAARYESALSMFRGIHGQGPVWLFRAPGRVNLIGEHTDYNHGYVLPVALDKDTLLLVRQRDDDTVVLHNVESQFPPIAFRISSEIPPAERGDWSNYGRGAAQMLAQSARDISRGASRPLRGFDALVVGEQPFGVPRGAGLSSSSALTVAFAVALAYLNDQPATGMEFAHSCADAEWYVGTRGGIMDHFIALLGRRDHAMFLDCRPVNNGRYRIEHVPMPGDYRLLVVNSGVRHENARGEYNYRVAACRAGVALLRKEYPSITHLRDLQDVPWEELASLLPEEVTAGWLWERGFDLGDIPGLTADEPLKVRSRCRHVWTENARVLDAMTALHADDIPAVGRLLDEAHASARDDYEVSCPELECLVAAANEIDGVAGARLTGAGWGGCIVALVQADAVSDFAEHLTGCYRGETGREAAVFTCCAGPGAGLVGMTA